MEEMPGREIGHSWYNMSEEQRVKMIFDIVKREARIFSIPLPASGSIYYAQDLGPPVEKVDLVDPLGLEQFCIGPSTALSLWYGKRSQLEVARGPCKFQDPCKPIIRLTKDSQRIAGSV